MCRSASEAGGPRRCPSHARARYAAALAQVTELVQYETQHHRAELTAEQHDALRRIGIRTGGTSSTSDYPVIAERAGDLEAWGFTRDGATGNVQTTPLTNFIGLPLDSRIRYFLEGLDDPLGKSIREYTGPWYQHINDAVIGPPPDPHPIARTHARKILRVLLWFNEIQQENRHDPQPWPCATVVRGATTTTLGRDFFDAVYPVGARIETVKITSTTTTLDVARKFATDDDDYFCVIRTRSALPISLYAGFRESEAMIAPGTALRCVHTDREGIDGKPTVYLVSEDLVSEAA